MDIAGIYELFQQSSGIETDTRKLSQGCIFFALSGENFDGNQFISFALEHGAAYCVGDNTAGLDDERIITVKNSLETLQKLARHHRETLDIPVIAITGSNGKTTTKELLHAVLSEKYKTYTTVGNLNNHIGVPLTLLSIKNDAEIAIVEMGANHIGEIASYCSYTLPTHGLITNCGKAHLEGFGDVEGVIKGKTELFEYLAAHEGTVFLNTDLAYLETPGARISKQVTFGACSGETRGKIINSENFLDAEFTVSQEEPFTIHSNLVGGYNLPNMLAAVTAGKYFKVEIKVIKSALENYMPTNSRSQKISVGSNDIILDAYNANPSSMEAAVLNFAAMPGDNKVIILGSMMELGKDSAEEHTNLVRLVNNYSWNAMAFCGPGFKDLVEEKRWFIDAPTAGKWFHQEKFQYCKILIKGSRSMKMEKVLKA
ncbi:MAG: UDP-N-acetylmuramoyl-tripeptide--D-alanyl-D-alanine ligase [Ferruginibacter sp.]